MLNLHELFAIKGTTSFSCQGKDKNLIPNLIYVKKPFSWEEKLFSPLIATPNVDKAIEEKWIAKKLRYRLHV